MSTFEDQARLRPYLLPGERIVWTGRPRGGSLLREIEWGGVGFALFFALLAYLQFVKPGSEGPAAFVEANLVVGTLLILFGIGCFLLRPLIRRRILYAVTNQRLMILGRKARHTLESHDLAWLPMLVLEDQGEFGTITVEDESEREHVLQVNWRGGPEHVGFAFARIDRPRQVYDVIVRESRDRRLSLDREPLSYALAG